MIIVLTGPKKAGKSTTILKLADAAKNAGKSVGGIVSRRLWQQEVDGYEIMNLADGSVTVLAKESGFDGEETFQHCSFTFSRKAVDAGNKAIMDALGKDVLFIDEIGNLEVDGKAWYESLKHIPNREKPVVLGVREDTVGKLESIWGIKADRIFRLAPETDSTAEILALIV